MISRERTRIECETLEVAQSLQFMHGGRTAAQTVGNVTRFYWLDIRYTQSDIFADLPGNIIIGYAPERMPEQLGAQPMHL